jgi:xylan 1,4-beta-xylosidase
VFVCKFSHKRMTERFSEAVLLPCIIRLLVNLNAWLQFKQKTVCNPVNIGYGYTPICNIREWVRHRATADPAVVIYKDDYYFFSTN